MNKEFALSLIKNEIGVILKTAKIKYVSDIFDDKLCISFTDKSLRDKAYNKLVTRFNNHSMFGYTSSIETKFDYFIYISLK